MRKEKEVLNKVINWASPNELVRIITLTSSRTNPKIKTDLFSDYDIEIAVTNVKEFLNNESWLSDFGEILALIKEDSEDNSATRLVLYKDYVRIDFQIYPVTHFAEYLKQLPKHWNIGYNILLDKDGITQNLQPPDYTAYNIQKPGKDEFTQVVTDFWWDSTYVAKSLWRDEVFCAKYMLDSIRPSYLLKMIEWHIALQHNWEVTINKSGRFIKQYLDSETCEKLENTYAASSIKTNWEALFAATHLFRQLATKVAAKLNYDYPQKLDSEISVYLEKIKNLDKDATDIE